MFAISTSGIHAHSHREPSQTVSSSRSSSTITSSSNTSLAALQILPYRSSSAGDSYQISGPDVHTTGWVVVEHWRDGSSIEHDHFRTEAKAIEVAQALAADSGAFVEPYPWVIAVCVADGWEVVPVHIESNQPGEAWSFQRAGEGASAFGIAQRTVFDAWRACLAFASFEPSS